MLLTLSATMPDARDLGFLMHKHPDRAQSFPVSVGTAHVIWPEANAQRSTVALLLEVDPIALVRHRSNRRVDGFSLAQFVNDRPYAASSMLAVALGKVFGTAMTGRCDARPELPGVAIPLQVRVPALPSRGGVDLVRRLFSPLGWEVEATAVPLDPALPGWGESPYVDLGLSGTLTVADALTQLYVLMPVLDDSTHYWVGQDEVDKLLRAGGEWLPVHPERDLIAQRYLGHHRDLVTTAVQRLVEADDTSGDSDDGDPDDDDTVEKPTPMSRQRSAAVLAVLRAEGAARVADIGCGEGQLLRTLISDVRFTAVLGADVSHRALVRASRRLQLDRMPDTQRARLELIQSSLSYRDDRLVGYDAIVLMEVIEHLDPARLPALERTVLGHARPRWVVVTTPNAEYNVRYPGLAAGAMRHPDHRFEWTRRQFRTWAEATAGPHGYTVDFSAIGEDDPEVGPPTQMAVFRRTDATAEAIPAAEAEM